MTVVALDEGKMLLIGLALCVLSALADAQGFVHAARVWNGGSLVLPQVAAEIVSPYPPGIPALVPGERITQPLVDLLVHARQTGMYAPDLGDPELKTLRVVSG